MSSEGELSRYDEDVALMNQAFGVGGSLTELERTAVREFLIREKLERFDNAEMKYEQVEGMTYSEMRSMLERQKAVRSSELDSLMEGGNENFRMRVCERLRQAEQTGEFAINHCPLCRKIVRTALAKQCLWCGADWHQE